MALFSGPPFFYCIFYILIAYFVLCLSLCCSFKSSKGEVREKRLNNGGGLSLRKERGSNVIGNVIVQSYEEEGVRNMSKNSHLSGIILVGACVGSVCSIRCKTDFIVLLLLGVVLWTVSIPRCALNFNCFLLDRYLPLKLAFDVAHTGLCMSWQSHLKLGTSLLSG